MRFVSLVNSVVGKVRRGVSQGLSVGVGSAGEDESNADPARLVEQMRQMMARVNKLEASAPPDAVEFEVVLGSGGAITELFHKLNGPTRWWVTAWLPASGVVSPLLPPCLVRHSTTDANVLRLRSYVAGRAVVRVELSQNYIETGADAGNGAGVAPTDILNNVAHAEQTADVTVAVAAGAVTLLSASLTTVGAASHVEWHFTSSFSNSVVGSVIMRGFVDGVKKKGSAHYIAVNTASGAIALSGCTAVTPGSHTVLIDWKTNAGTASILPTTTPDLYHASLTVREVP